jgi:hypothetical protein
VECGVDGVLVNYTFLMPGFSMQRTNVYADVKGQILKGFSNMPEILQAYPMAEREGFEPPIPVKVCPLSRRPVIRI